MELFWSGFLLSLSLCLDLGLVNMAAMRAGVQVGAVQSFAIGLGSCFGDLAFAAIAMLGVAVVLDAPGVRCALWIGGSLILVYLAIKMFKESLKFNFLLERNDSAKVIRSSPFSYFMQGFALAIASPSAILWFASVGGAVIATAAEKAQGAPWLFFSGFFVSGFFWSLFVAVASNYGKRFGPGFSRIFSILSAFVFAGLACKVFWDGYRSFVSP